MTTSSNELKSALVGVDFSSGAQQALRVAALLARSGLERVTAHHVVDHHGIRELSDALSLSKDDLVTELTEKGNAKLREWVDEIGFTPPAAITSSFGHPGKELLQLSDDYDLLILGERGESHPGRGVGTMAVHCVRKSKGRVLLVNGGGDQPSFDRIVACVDFSPASEKVVKEATLLGNLLGSELVFLHVYRAPWDRLHYRAPTAEASPHFRREYLEMLQKQMDECLIGVDYKAQRNVLHRASSYGYGIADFVKHEKADLVVLGTHGRSTLKELYLGSTAERLLRELPCSVMTVRTAK